MSPACIDNAMPDSTVSVPLTRSASAGLQGAAERVAQLEQEVGRLQAECLALKQEAQATTTQGAESSQVRDIPALALAGIDKPRIICKLFSNSTIVAPLDP